MCKGFPLYTLMTGKAANTLPRILAWFKKIIECKVLTRLPLDQNNSYINQAAT